MHSGGFGLFVLVCFVVVCLFVFNTATALHSWRYSTKFLIWRNKNNLRIVCATIFLSATTLKGKGNFAEEMHCHLWLVSLNVAKG